MCGIAGEIWFDEARSARGWADRAGDLMRHRGPDGDGVFVAPGVALVHRRLSIIDLAGGAQPMSYAGERLWLTFNGEIYNYRELRAELAGRGLAFRTRSDTEVVLAAFAAWGVAAFARLDGIFAFGLWDRDARALYLVRDHLGVKPLLYHRDADGLRFASEFKALLAHSSVGARVDPSALRQYLELGYVLTPRTIVAGVAKLPAGHYLHARGDALDVRSFWDLAAVACEEKAGGPSDAERCARFDELLDATVAQQMVSDVPLGSFLSGGLDSSTIAYYAQRHARGALETFSMGFAEASFSEQPYAERVAQHLHTKHHQATVRAKTLDELGQLVWYYDEPLGDTSIVPTYDLADLARRHVTVALSGDGCDEILAGYDTYLADLFQRLYAHVPERVHRSIVAPLVALLPSSYRKVSLDYQLKQFVANARATPERAHYGWRGLLDARESAALAGQVGVHGAEPFDAYREHFAAVAGAHPLDQALYVDLKTWLVDDILTKVDRATMARGLEARVPFLAPRLVEHAMRLPTHLKLRGLQRKAILKKVMRGRLPSSIVGRRKRGFNAPVSHWLRGPLREPVSELFASGSSTILDLRSTVLRDIWQQHLSGTLDHGYKLWTVLSLALWEQRVLQAPKAIPGSA